MVGTMGSISASITYLGRRGRALGAVFVLLLGGCAHLPDGGGMAAADRAHLLSGEALLGEAAAGLQLPEQPFLSVSNEMRAFLDQTVPRRGNRATRLDALIYALRHAGMLGFEYVAERTYTAEEAFDNRSGNCLAFTALLVASGREVGLEVRFNEVDIPPSWGLQGELTYVLYRHINANVVRGRRDQVIVDVAPDIYQPEYRQTIISDSHAEAQYYNNLATEHMVRGDTYQAFRHFKKALSLAPGASFLWSNLGTLYLRHGHRREAEAAFLHALHRDTGNLAAISSLERFYVNEQQPEKAELYRRQAQNVRNRNPYYRYHKAEQAYGERDYAAAVAHSLAAVAGNAEDHRFHFLLGISYLNLGRRSEGEAALEKALQYANAETTKQAYQVKWRRVLADL